MAKSLIPEIARMLGVEIGEEFKVKGEDELMTYSFNSDGLQVTYGDGIEIPYISTNSALVALVKGEEEIIKLQWQPKKCDVYYTFGSFAQTWRVSRQIWTHHPFDLAVLDKGWVFRTWEEAQAALPSVAKELGVEYKL